MKPFHVECQLPQTAGAEVSAEFDTFNVTEAYDKGVRDEDIVRHTRHRDLRTMRGYVQRAGLVGESPAGQLDL
jgi:hypothetical protein